MREHKQLHITARDEQGRFNALAAGRPDFNPDFLDDLQAGIDDMFAAGRVANLTPPPTPHPITTINPFAIEAAIALLKVEIPHYHEVLTYFQTPAGNIRHAKFGDPLYFATQLVPPVDVRGLYRLKRQACYAVWERLPLTERVKTNQQDDHAV